MTESPTYTLEMKEDHFEIRRYPDYILAQVDVESDYDSAVNIGFSILAKYIFGGNKKLKSISITTPVSEEKIKGSERIPMAAPVTEEASGEKIHRISFTMPSKYTLKTLPEPDDARIKFKEVKNQKTAVLRFSGRVKKKLAWEKMEEMGKWLEKNNFKLKSNFIVAQYNNPAVPGFFRRNEIFS